MQLDKKVYISKKGMRFCANIYNVHGCEINSLDLVRDDDLIIAAESSECFRKPGKKQISKQEIGTNAFFTLFKEALKIILKVHRLPYYTMVTILYYDVCHCVAYIWNLDVYLKYLKYFLTM